MNFRSWLHAVLAAFISGAATAITAVVVAPELDWKKVGTMALVSGILSVATLLKQSPLPDKE